VRKKGKWRDGKREKSDEERDVELWVSRLEFFFFLLVNSPSYAVRALGQDI
jgi:hypothetical protein